MPALPKRHRRERAKARPGLVGDVRVHFRVANPCRAEDAFDGGGLAIAEISWRK